MPIRTEGRVLGATIRAGESVDYPLGAERKAYLVSATGRIEVNGIAAHPRDGVAIAQEENLRITALDDAEIVLVETA